MYIAWTKEDILKPKFYIFLTKEDCIEGSDELGLPGDLEVKEIDPYKLPKIASAIVLGVKQINYDNEHGEITPHYIVGLDELSYLAVRKVTSWFLERHILEKSRIIYYTNPSCKSRAKRMS